jgi:predicted transcriptional regulator of viral defense system
MDVLTEIRSLVRGEVFDYQMLAYCLRKYKKPRDKITQLLASQKLIQVKRGVYIFGPSYRRGLLSMEVVAGMLVQPSYISREYALQIYGILSERVERITSMTTRKKKHFETPIGVFDFYSIHPRKFGIGVAIKEIEGAGGGLMASLEKALADWLSSIPVIANQDALRFFLFEESRIEEKALRSLNWTLLKEIAVVVQNRNVDLLTQIKI